MKIVTQNIDEFIQCLKEEKSLHRNTIHVSLCRNPEDGNVRSATKFNVTLQASAVVTSEEGEYLLETAEYCGVDYEDKSQEKEGSKQAVYLRGIIAGYCKKRGWRMLPGIISE